MAMAESWFKAEVPGPKKALVITKPEVVAAMIKRAKHPILVVGHKAAEMNSEDFNLVDFLIEFTRKSGVPIVTTAHIVNAFVKRGFKPAGFMPAVDIANRLADPNWMGIDGKGQHDLALFIGLHYYMEWTILSGLKNFARNLTTITLDKFYHPNANWSFPNISFEDWIKNLKTIAEKFEGGENK